MKTNWAEAIWTTNNSQKLITKDVGKTIYEFLKEEFHSQGCEVKAINGTADHVHCLFNVNSKKAMDDIIKMVKGVSSHSVNQTGLIKTKFAWEKSYKACGIGKSELKGATQKILDQEALHSDPSFTVIDEINQMDEYEDE